MTVPVPDDSARAVSRRNFLASAGKAGVALAVLDGVLAPTTAAAATQTPADAADLANGAVVQSVLHTESLAPVVGAVRAPVAPAAFSGLKWRDLGPSRGGRVVSASGVPGRPNEFYFGSVNGGVWKSIDAGRVWTPIFDSQPMASIGAISVAKSAPNTVYVGSGESSLRDSMGYGNGVYKSTDAGKTWTHLGLENTQHIGKIAIDPHNADIVFVAAIGHLYAANPDRGVFKTIDGGKTWKKVLFHNDDVGAVEVVIDPNDSRVVYAGLWNTRRPPWFTYAPTNGPGGGIWKSTDSGASWKQITHGLPADGIGRTGIAVAPTNSNRVYAVVDCLLPDANAPKPAGANAPAAGQGGFFRSDDAGATWTKLSSDQALWGRGWYFEKVTVDPKNPDIVYVPNVAVNRSKDGGKTWVALRGSPGGDDYHQAWVSPDESDTMIVASDQGAIITRNATADDPRDVTWSSWLNQPTAQMYHISVDYRFPYWVTGAQQDSGAVAVCSRGKFATLTMRDWEPVGAGGESGYTAGDPLHPGIIYGGMGSRQNLIINAPVAGTTAPRGPETLRADWTQPLVLSKADPRALYYSAQYVFKSTDSAATWTQISPDLTRAELVVPTTLDAAAAAQVDRNGKKGVVYALAPSPLLVPMVWAGTDDGLIHLTVNDGRTWTNVTPSAVAPWSRVTMIEASHFDFPTAYASVDRHQLQDYDPYIYRTRDSGKTWQRITTGLPAGVYVHTIKEDTVRQGLLFAGTERGTYVSFNDGDNWQSLQQNLPVTSVRDFEIYGDDLIVGTHGRGIWVIDSMSALRQIDDATIAAAAYLFKPADATYVTESGDNGTPTQKDEAFFPNAENGAYLDYYLRTDATTPVTIEVVDGNNAVVRTFSTDPGVSGAAGVRAGRGGGGVAVDGIPSTSALWRVPVEPMSSKAGMHRVVWTPVTAGGGRGGRGGGATPLTGMFTAKLTANGVTMTQPIVIKPDPRIAQR
jgi:photosystem II stability/assembly factor-like uncharacterized protein